MSDPRTIRDGIALASHWIHTCTVPHLAAFVGGSAATLPDSTPLAPTSDIDCYLVTADVPPPGKLGKIQVDGVVLDVTSIPWSHIEQAEGNAVLASLINFGVVIADTDGLFGRRQRDIRSGFGDPAMVATRMNDMAQRIRAITRPAPTPVAAEEVMNWIFPATLATHLPLIRSLAPLTVRKRFVAARAVMEASDYEGLLACYGFADVSADQTHRWLNLAEHLLTENAPFAAHASRFWAGDIRADARHIAIGGSQELIDAGLHREALYWIIATSARCLTVRADAGAPVSRYDGDFAAMTEQLAIRTQEQRAQRSADILNWVDAYLST